MTPPATMLVDDNPANLKLAISVLESTGHAPLGARSAEEAQAVLKHTRPDLILMDLQMPGMDGLTLTRLLKADPDYQGIPIVALTASAMRGDETKALEAGCVAYITKPIETRRLGEKITAILRGNSEARKP